MKKLDCANKFHMFNKFNKFNKFNNVNYKKMKGFNYKRVGVTLPSGVSRGAKVVDAIMDYGYLGPFRNKLGTAVGYTRLGEHCARVYVKRPNNPRTPAQVAQRNRWSLASEIVKGVYPAAKHGMLNTGVTGRYGALMSLNVRNVSMQSGSLTFDFSKLTLTTMSEELPISLSLSGSTVTASWQAPDVTSPFLGGTAYVVAVTEKEGHPCAFASEGLDQGSCTLDLTDLGLSAGAAVHLYAFAATEKIASKTYRKDATVA